MIAFLIWARIAQSLLAIAAASMLALAFASPYPKERIEQNPFLSPAVLSFEPQIYSARR